MGITGWVILGAVNIPTYIVIGSYFFEDLDGFVEALQFWATPNIVSALDGEYDEDRWATLKLFLFVAACAAVVFGEGIYLVIPHVLPLFR
jgi:hypothetical protein